MVLTLEVPGPFIWFGAGELTWKMLTKKKRVHLSCVRFRSEREHWLTRLQQRHCATLGSSAACFFPRYFPRRVNFPLALPRPQKAIPVLANLRVGTYLPDHNVCLHLLFLGLTTQLTLKYKINVGPFSFQMKMNDAMCWSGAAASR